MPGSRKQASIAFVALSLVLCVLAKPGPEDYFAIKIVDDRTGRGVPLVRLKTVIGVVYWTDSAGVVAFGEPALLGKEVYFWIETDGYRFKTDEWGYPGMIIQTKPNASITLPITRTMKSQRLYRMTGEAIYGDTLLTGGRAPIAQPWLNMDVVGLDSVQVAVYKDKIYWFWGDTWRALHLQLSNWGTTGATSVLPKNGGLPGSVGIDFTYISDGKGFVKPMCPYPNSSCWVAGVAVVQDRLIAYGTYMDRIKEWTMNDWAFLLFNDTTQQLDVVSYFGVTSDYSMDMNGALGGAQVVFGNDSYIYFIDGYAYVRCIATISQLSDLRNFEAWTPLKQGTTVKQGQIERNNQGQAESFWNLMDASGGPDRERVWMLRSTIWWNPLRGKYSMIGWAGNGKVSPMGEYWYTESAAIHGPYRTATRVVTHDWTKMTLYNPCRLNFFDEAQGRVVYFAGTYTTFMSPAQPTPLYDYNNVVFSLDLAGVGEELDASISKAAAHDHDVTTLRA